MKIEERIRYLLRASLRAEGEGNQRVAATLRRMAEEARPAGEALSTRTLELAGMECCPE